MKLATILAASVAANERWFSTDKYQISSNVDDWWYSGPKVPANQMNKMRSTASKSMVTQDGLSNKYKKIAQSKLNDFSDVLTDFDSL